MKGIVLAVLLPLFGRAQSPPVVPGQEAGVASVSIFKGTGDSAIIQAVWQLDPAVLRYETDSVAGGIRAEYFTRAQLFGGGKEIRKETWRTRTPLVKTANEIGSLQLLDGWKLPAVAGSYRIRLSFWGKGWEEKSVHLSMPLEVPAFEGKEKVLSLPQLLDTAYAAPAKSTSPFARGGQMRIPLTTNFLGEERGRLRFYVEAYNFKEGDFKKSKARWQATILKGGMPLSGFSATDSSGSGSTWEGMIPVTALVTGNYILKTALTDAAGKEILSSQRSFQRSNVGYVPPADTTPLSTDEAIGPRGKPVDLKNSFVGKFTEEQLPKVLRMLLPQATPDEGVAIQQLSAKVDPLYRRGFIYSFWIARNAEDPEGAWKAYSEKVRTVNREFKAANHIGYETDRGRVYLHYGAPAERVKMVQEAGSRPYEVWRYTDMEGHSGAFLFYQPAGPLDDYVQLHSTVSGAVKNYNWRRFLYVDGLNERSRAEQYFPERN